MPLKYHQNKSTFRRQKRRKRSAVQKKIWLSKLIPITLATGLMAIGYVVWVKLHDPRALPFHQVRIVGQLQHLQAIALQKKARQEISGGFFAVDMVKIKQSLMEVPWIEDVSIRRMPGVLTVRVQEQQPIARWNGSFLVNTKKQIFLAPHDAPKNLPELKGPAPSEMMVVDYYLKMTQILKPLSLQISQLQLDDRDSWQLTLSNGIAVTIGREDVLPRMQRLTKWYPTLVGEKADQVVHIDLRYQNNLAIEWKK